jgi:hypothetical protein
MTLLTLLSDAQNVSGTLGTLAKTLDDATTRTGVALPLLFTSGAYSNATGTVAAGSGAVTGSLSVTLDGVTSAGTGTVRVSGSLSATLGAVALSGTGAVSSGPNGSLAATLGNVTAAATGTVTGVGTAPKPEQPSGGYGAQNEYNAARQRRKRRKRDEDESKPPDSLSIVAQAGPGSSDATQTAPAADLELVRQLVAYWSGEGDRERLNRRAQRALDYALRAQSVLAMQLFERELARQMEEDADMQALLLILADD